MSESEIKYGLKKVGTRWYALKAYESNDESVHNVFVSHSLRNGEDVYVVSTVSKKKPEEPSVYVGEAYTMQKAAEVANYLAKGLIESAALRRLYIRQAEERLNK